MITLTSPTALPWHFFALEWLIIGCFLMTAVHAFGRYRAGDRYPAFQWLVIVAYGLSMELIAFHYWQNYAHSTFSVQLYNGLLPLYISALYPVFYYVGLKTVDHHNLPWWKEALIAGLAICLLDIPFDTIGVSAGWWVWGAPAEVAVQEIHLEAVKTRWLGVPVTSYLWYLVFGGILTAVLRGVRGFIERRSLTVYLLAAPPTALLIIVLGVLAFQPLFWGPRAVGISDDVIVIGVMLLGLAAAMRSPRGAPSWVGRVTLTVQAFMLGVLLYSWAGVESPNARLAVLIAAMVTSGLLRRSR
ncbi:MAG: hypothetical protein ACI8RZ_006131 [Myxococcota bacterium]|jgi:hypothetical protein